MKRGRPPRENPHVERSSIIRWNAKKREWETFAKPQRYRLGVAMGAVEDEKRNDTFLDAERLEFFARKNRHIRALIPDASILRDSEADRIAYEVADERAEQLALAEMTRLRRNGGTWLTSRPARGRPPSRKNK